MGQAAYQLSARGSRERNDNHSWEIGIRTENDARGVLSDALHDGLGQGGIIHRILGCIMYNTYYYLLFVLCICIMACGSTLLW